MEFFTSPLGATIAWFASVIGGVIAIYQTIQVKKYKKEIKNIRTEISGRNGSVTQNGLKNAYTENVSGDMHIDM